MQTDTVVLIDTADIAEMTGLTRDYVRDRVTKRPDFPAPVLKLSRKTVRWSREDIARWLEVQALRAAGKRAA